MKAISDQEEMAELRREWSPWLSRIQLAQGLEALTKMPFDQKAKDSLTSSPASRFARSKLEGRGFLRR